MAEETGALDLQRVHEPQHVLRHLLDRIFHHRLVALPAAAVVVHDHPEVLRELRHLLEEARANAAQARHQQQRLARAVLFVMQRAITDRDFWHWSYPKNDLRATAVSPGFSIWGLCPQPGSSMSFAPLNPA